MKRIIYLSLLFVFYVGFVNPVKASETDSLQQVYDTLTRVDQRAAMAYTISYQLFKSQPLKALSYSQDAIFLYRDLQSSLWEAKSLRLHHLACVNAHMLDSAFVSLRQAHKILERLSDSQLLIRSKIDLAILHTEAYSFEKAYGYLVGAEEGIEASRPHEPLLRHLAYGLGYWYWMRGDYAMSLEQYSQALVMEESMGAPSLDLLFQIAKCHVELGSYDQAEKYFTQIKKRAADTNVQDLFRVYLENEYGLLALKQNAPEKAIEAFLKAQAGMYFSDQNFQIILLNNISEAHMALGQYSLALTPLQKAYRLRDSISKQYEINRTYELLVDTYESMGFPTKALAYSKELSDLKVMPTDPEEEQRAQLRKSFANIEARFAMEEQAIIDAKMKRWQVFGWAGFGFGLFVLLGLGSWYLVRHSRHQKKVLEETQFELRNAQAGLDLLEKYNARQIGLRK